MHVCIRQRDLKIISDKINLRFTFYSLTNSSLTRIQILAAQQESFVTTLLRTMFSTNSTAMLFYDCHLFVSCKLCTPGTSCMHAALHRSHRRDFCRWGQDILYLTVSSPGYKVQNILRTPGQEAGPTSRRDYVRRVGCVHVSLDAPSTQRHIPLTCRIQSVSQFRSRHAIKLKPRTSASAVLA